MIACRISAAVLRVPTASARIKRQRRLAFGQIVAEVLADGRMVAGVVEHVVDQLERGAQMRAVARQRILQRRRSAPPSTAPSRAAASNSLAVLRWITSR